MASIYHFFPLTQKYSFFSVATQEFLKPNKAKYWDMSFICVILLLLEKVRPRTLYIQIKREGQSNHPPYISMTTKSYHKRKRPSPWISWDANMIDSNLNWIFRPYQYACKFRKYSHIDRVNQKRHYNYSIPWSILFNIFLSTHHTFNFRNLVPSSNRYQFIFPE